MRISHRTLLLALVFLTAAGMACRKRPGGGAGLKVKPAAEARSTAMAIIVAPNLDRTFDRVGAVAKELNLPFDVGALRTKALDEMKIPSTLVAAIDASAPMSIVVLPKAPNAKDPRVAIAVSLKDASSGKKVMEAMGKPIAQKDDAAGFKAKDGSDVWLWAQDRKLVAAESVESLINGAALALETLHSSDDDVIATVNPDAIARAEGTDLKTAMAKATEEMKAAPSSAEQGPVMRALVQAMMSYFSSRIVDTQDAQFMIRVDAKRGAALGMKLRPRAGTAFARSVAQSAPYALDPAVLAGGEATMVSASSPMPFVGELWREIAAQLIKADPAMAETVKLFDPLLTSITGACSAAARTGGERWQQDGIYQLAAGVAPQTYLDAVAAATASPLVPKLLAALGIQGKVKVTRDKDVVLGEMKLAYSGMPAQQAQSMKSMMGDKFEFAMTARDGRIYSATGPGARGRLTALMAPPAAPAAPTGELATALDETRGADGFVFMDLMQSMKAGMAGLGGGASAMGAMQLPMWISYRGGQTLSGDWRIPMSSLRTVGMLVPMLMMFMGGAGGGGPQ